MAVRNLAIQAALARKLKAGWKIIAEGGWIVFFRSVKDSIVYHLRSKWHFVYLEFSLEKTIFSFALKEPISVRVASREDYERIQSDIFPFLRGALAYDRKYLELLGEPKIKCFVAEKDGKLVHYSWVFEDVFDSPIIKVPFDHKKLKGGDAYIGPIFTNPDVRGFIYLQVCSTILHYLKENNCASRVIVLVEGGNPSAVTFYQRFGFREIANAQPAGIFSYLWERSRWQGKRLETK